MKRKLLILGLLAIMAGAAFYIFHPRGGKLPPEVVTALQESEQMTLYSIDPYSFPAFPESPQQGVHFHEYRSLGETVISDAKTRRQVARSVQKGVSAWNGRRYNCFNPRHGLRVVRGAQVYDLLICFECQRVAIFDGEVTGGDVKLGEKALGHTGIRGPAGVLDEILRAARIPLEAPSIVNH